MALSGPRNRLTTSVDVTPPGRSASGFKAMNMRADDPAVEKNEAPTDELTPPTAGSASTAWTARSCRSFICSNEASGAPCMNTDTRPVSSVGKKPFGSLVKRNAVAAITTGSVASVSQRQRSAVSRLAT